MQKILREFITNSGAQTYARGVTIGTQLLLIPIMISTWGLEVYGGWLAIDSLRTIFSLADLGLAQIAANEMTLQTAAKNTERAQIINASTWAMLIAVGFALLAIGAFASFLPIADILNISRFSDQVPLAFFLLSMVAAGSILFGAVGAGLRANGLYWLMVVTNASYQLGVALSLGIWGLNGGGYLAVATTIVAIQLALFSTAAIILWVRHPWTRPNFSLVSVTQIRSMLAPSFSYMLYTFTNLVTIQGVNILVSSQLGPDKVTVISAIRTLTRIGRMFAAIFIYALEPIFARLSGERDLDTGARIYRLMVWSGVVGSVLYWVCMVTLGPDFLAWWTHEAVTGWNTLHYLMTTAIAVEIVWFTLQTPYVSTNRHSLLAAWVAVSGIASTVATGLLLGTFGLLAAGTTLVAMHICILAATVWVMRRHPPFF
ncbi:lipopolysaccharide biosynthesis protein [Ruegeria atlantica]|uniref:lipopolysaccharide biosynthesis protein n=1 Tax=Ruegeria atlantica TaxID=81569 RepID=UPI001481CDC9|nr:hypothetical protein [Ruegeria atlantica]